MIQSRQPIRKFFLLGILSLTGCHTTDSAQLESISPPPAKSPIVEALAPPNSDSASQMPEPTPLQADLKPLPINLPTALQLANVRALDIATAADRIRVAAAQLQQAEVLWLPSITVGGDYNRHDGKVQDIAGHILDVSKSSMMFGAGSGIGSAAILNVSDAIFNPLAARQTVSAREADRQAAANDTLYAVSEAYFNVQQARGELAGATLATQKTEEVVTKTRKLAPSLVPELETDRAEAELARCQQYEVKARERLKVSSAELLRIIRLDASAVVVPAEPPHLLIQLIDLSKAVDDLIPIALINRPELASMQAQVKLTLTLLKQEKLRPLIPSVLLRGFSTPVTGTLAAGVFTGGINGNLGNTGLRGDLDLQLLWQLDNLGLGNLGKIQQRESENRLALNNLFKIQDRVAAEVAQAYALATEAAARVKLAEKGVKFALRSADKNILALGQTRGAANLNLLIIRPQEAVAAAQALAQAYNDYYGAVADANRAQFRLYRALGQPAECLLQDPKALKPDSPTITPGVLKTEKDDKNTDKPGGDTRDQGRDKNPAINEKDLPKRDEKGKNSDEKKPAGNDVGPVMLKDR